MTEWRAAFEARPHLVDPSRSLAAWITEPPGMVAQVIRPITLTPPHAQWLVNHALKSLLQRFPGDERLVLVLDLSLIAGRDPAARPIIMEAARAITWRIQRASVVPPSAAGRVYVASVTAAASLARVFGLTISVESLPDALKSLHAAPEL